MWTCPRCSEQLEDQFDACWKCANQGEEAGADPERPDASDPQSFSAQIDAICDRFEAAWKAQAPGTPGRRPRIQDFLGEVPEAGRAELFRHLLALELYYRKAAGETPELAEYRERFPDYLAAVADAFPTIDGRAATDRPAVQANPPPRALHVRCPHCHNPIEIVNDRPLTDLTCPSCGEKVTLVFDDTVDRVPGSATTASTGPKRIGHFELLETLGTGGFGTVWKARDTKLDRIVAVKIPRKGQLDREETEKFLREARAAAQLRHPGIVGVHEVGIEGETVYIVSDFIAGLSLDKWLEGQRPTPRKAAELCIKIAEALHHAHEKGVIHRNLKPGNIMLDAAGETHVMDFGLASARRAKSR